MTDIRYRVLPDDEYDRLKQVEPRLSRGYDRWCPTCDKNKGPNENGLIVVRGTEVECDCECQVALHKWYLAAGIGTTFQRLDWNDYAGPEGILIGVEKYLDKRTEFVRRGMGLYFSGSYGTGKTMLASLVLKEMVKFGYTAFSTTFARTIDMFTAGMGQGGREDKEWFRRKFINSQFLLLDDVGKELRSEAASRLSQTVFDSVLRERVTNGRPTIITTNLDAEDLDDGYGGAILSLIREKSLEQVFTGDDYRPKANARELDEVLKGWTREIV